MAQEHTSDAELQYLTREVAREMGENLPKDLGFFMLIFHKGDGMVAWSGNADMDLMRSQVRDWLERADKMKRVES